MTNICSLNFEVIINVHSEYADELGKDLAKWLEESWFNGEDILEVKYKDSKVLL